MLPMFGIFLDSETNGLNPKNHRLLEIAYKIVDLSSGKLTESYHAILLQPAEVWQKSDPSSLQINGFTQELLQQRGSAEENVKKEILRSFQKIPIGRKNAVFICQNPSFDRAFFSQLIDPDLQESLSWPSRPPGQLGVDRPVAADRVQRRGPAADARVHQHRDGADHLVRVIERPAHLEAAAQHVIAGRTPISHRSRAVAAQNGCHRSQACAYKVASPVVPDVEKTVVVSG